MLELGSFLMGIFCTLAFVQVWLEWHARDA